MPFPPIPGPPCPPGPYAPPDPQGPAWAFRVDLSPPRGKRSCNRHIDCDEAEEKERAKGHADFSPLSMHCITVDCTDCIQT